MSAVGLFAAVCIALWILSKGRWPGDW